jgi:cytochrome c5
MSKEKDQVFFRNFFLIVGALAVMMVIFIVAARFIGIDEKADVERRAGAVSERTAPMGQVSVINEAADATDMVMENDVAMAEEATEMAGSPDSCTGNEGKQVFDSVCAACHSSGIPGIPQLADTAAWAERIAQGNDVLYENAIQGFTGNSGMMMPPRGANPDLCDDDVKAAVDYMVANSQ